MTKEEAKELWPVIKAFSEGKTIQCKYIEGGDNDWSDVGTPIFDTMVYAYRIKPKSKYRPFQDDKECWNEMQKHQPFGWVKDKDVAFYRIITKISRGCIHLHYIDRIISLAEGFKYLTFTDGTPFGIEEEG